jgi:hypothetical protein
MAYLTPEQFFELTLVPQDRLDALQARYPRFLEAQLEGKSGVIDSLLRKRYVAPFVAPYPEPVKQWLWRMLDPIVYLKIGVDASDEQISEIIADGQRVLVELKEAADAKEGLYDLPLRADTTTSGISKPTVLTQSDPTPYVGILTQAQRAGYR